MGSIVKNIYSWIALALVVASTSLMMLTFPVGVLSFSVIGLVTVLSLITWGVMYKNSDSFLNNIIQDAKDRDDKVLNLLKSDLLALDVKQGLLQLELIKNKHDDLVSVLNERFSSDELTLTRYRASADSLYKATTDNLKEVVVSLKAVRSTDIKRLEESVSDKSSKQSEVETKQERIDIYYQQHERVEKLLLLNEETLTLVAKMSSEWANSSPNKLTENSSEFVFAEAKVLIDRIQKYR